MCTSPPSLLPTADDLLVQLSLHRHGRRYVMPQTDYTFLSTSGHHRYLALSVYEPDTPTSHEACLSLLLLLLSHIASAVHCETIPIPGEAGWRRRRIRRDWGRASEQYSAFLCTLCYYNSDMFLLSCRCIVHWFDMAENKAWSFSILHHTMSAMKPKFDLIEKSLEHCLLTSRACLNKKRSFRLTTLITLNYSSILTM